MNMKTTLRYRSINAQATWRHRVEEQFKHMHLFSFDDVHGFCWHRQVEEQLKHIDSLTAITAAEVVLEYQGEAEPAFRVQVRLEVPGWGTLSLPAMGRQSALPIYSPSLYAEAGGNTLEAALLKATQELEHQVKVSQLPRLKRGQRKLQLSAIFGRWPDAQPGQRSSNTMPVLLMPKNIFLN